MQFGDELSAVVVSAGLAGREEDARIGGGESDGISLAVLAFHSVASTTLFIMPSGGSLRPMRITTWNCLGGFEKKLIALRMLHDPDIAVIQECSKKSIQSLDHEYSGFWMGGSYESKGHAIIWKRDWDVTPLSHILSGEGHDTWVAAFDVKGSEQFTIIAVWAHSESGGVSGYVHQIHKALQAHPEWFARGEVVIAGDFNSSFHWDKELAPLNHTSLVTVLGEKGLVSVYHSDFEDEGPRNESPTFHWRNDSSAPFHLDYVFFPKAWLPRKKSVRLGCHGDWKLLSDHCPLTLELGPATN